MCRGSMVCHFVTGPRSEYHPSYAIAIPDLAERKRNGGDRVAAVSLLSGAIAVVPALQEA